MNNPEMQSSPRTTTSTGGRMLYAIVLLAAVVGCDSRRTYDDSNPDEYMSHWCDPRNLSQSPAFQGDGIVPHDLSSLPSKEECMKDYYQRRDNEVKR